MLTTWMNLENSMLGERSQVTKGRTLHDTVYRKCPVGKSTDTENGRVVPRGCGEGRMGTGC